MASANQAEELELAEQDNVGLAGTAKTPTNVHEVDKIRKEEEIAIRILTNGDKKSDPQSSSIWWRRLVILNWGCSDSQHNVL